MAIWGIFGVKRGMGLCRNFTRKLRLNLQILYHIFKGFSSVLSDAFFTSDQLALRQLKKNFLPKGANNYNKNIEKGANNSDKNLLKGTKNY